SLFVFVALIFIVKKATVQYYKYLITRQTDELTKSELRFRTLVENSYEIISLVDEKMKFVYRSPSAERITGWKNDEKLPIGVNSNQVHPDDLEKTNFLMQTVLSSPGKPIHTSFRVRHKSGHYIWMEGLMTNMFHDENIRAILSNLRDVTERKNAEVQ